VYGASLMPTILPHPPLAPPSGPRTGQGLF